MDIILTGDRPTGKLHLGHYVGSLKTRVELQNKSDYQDMFVMIADVQALTDNFNNPIKIRNSIIDVVLDYLSVGLNPNKITIFIQSKVPALMELTMYFMNLVTYTRVQRNPTIKKELKLRQFDNIPVGFLCYPISQAADITAFKATLVPAGEDQLPMIEQTQEIVHKFNSIYAPVLVEPKIMLPNNTSCLRLSGIDGKNKMSKSLNNCIYLSDSKDIVRHKVMSMYTDPLHININDPGHLDGNTVFTYLDAFANDNHFTTYWKEYKNLNELKEHYTHGGVGDVAIKKFLNKILEEILQPIRDRRALYEKNLPYVFKILQSGCQYANTIANRTLNDVKNAMSINYF